MGNEALIAVKNAENIVNLGRGGIDMGRALVTDNASLGLEGTFRAVLSGKALGNAFKESLTKKNIVQGVGMLAANLTLGTLATMYENTQRNAAVRASDKAKKDDNEAGNGISVISDKV